MKIIRGEKAGAANILTVVIFLIIFVVASGVWEYMRLVTITREIRDAMTDATVAALAENAYNVYGGVREGYTGAYEIDAEDLWNINVVKGDLLVLTGETLGMTKAGDTLSARAYTIKVEKFDIDVEALAPAAPSLQLRTNATLLVGARIPHDFGWSVLPPADVDIKVDTSFVTRF
jgi:hypothetical protein